MVDNGSSLLVFFVNGKKKVGLYGTKLGCAEGGCGACTVMVSKFDKENDKIRHITLNACLTPICFMHGLAVTTVEGIGSTKTKLHAVQERIAKAHGSQCGFCTPGFVMSMYTLLRNQPKPTMDDIRLTLQGNLCRCTGYRPIMEAFASFAVEDTSIYSGYSATDSADDARNKNVCPMGDQCCRNGRDSSKDDCEVLFESSKFVPTDPSQEVIFPPELKIFHEDYEGSLVFKSTNTIWFRPESLEELLDLKIAYPEAKIAVGNTEISLETKLKNQYYPVLINPTSIPQLTKIEVLDNFIRIGASVTITEFEEFLQKQISCKQEKRESQIRGFKAILGILHRFGGKQIRNVASVGGNVMTSSPISDLNTIFLALKVELELKSKKQGSRSVYMDENLFSGYRRNIVKKDEVLVALILPYTEDNQFIYAYKQARRREDDIAVVNFAINVIFSANNYIIRNIRMAYGGMASTTTFPTNTCKSLIGRCWDNETLEFALDLLLKDLPLLSSAPGEASQHFYLASKEGPYDTMGRPIVHLSAFKQATGEAVYTDDITSFEDQLYMGLVMSSKAHAKIKSIDPSDALNMEKVHAFFSAKDIPKRLNKLGVAVEDDEIFVSEICTSVGQIIGVVIAEEQVIARNAAKKVKIEYEELQPVIVSFEDAIRYKSFIPNSFRKSERGDVDSVFKTTPHVVEGEIKTGAQEHFYLEPNVVIATSKKEDNELEIYCTTQNPAEITKCVAKTLNIPQNRVITKVKRIGGGFGGKETRPVALAVPAALAAHKLNRSVRCTLDRDEDILFKGTRNPFLMKYKTAFDENGKILGTELNIYVNAGRSSDSSVWAMEWAMLQFHAPYKTENIRITGICCKTNLQTCTAFRGFGSPQIILASESIIRDIASYLDKDITEIMEINFYQENDSTFYNEILENPRLNECWEECLKKSRYQERKKLVERFNSENRWKKRGISLVPLMYGVGYP